MGIIRFLGSDKALSVKALAEFAAANLESGESLLEIDRAALEDLPRGLPEMLKIAEDNALFVREMVNRIVATEQLKCENLDAACKINAAVCESYFKMRNMSVLADKHSCPRLVGVNAAAYFREFMALVKDALPIEISRNLRLITKLGEDTEISVSKQSLAHILINFLINAIMHGHTADKRIELIVGSVPGGGHVFAAVADHGVGVDAVRLRSAQRRAAPLGGEMLGVRRGCGLIICQRLAECMNAKILVANARRGGAVFTLILRQPDERAKALPRRLSDIAPLLGASEKRLITLSLAQFDNMKTENY